MWLNMAVVVQLVDVHWTMHDKVADFVDMLELSVYLASCVVEPEH